MDTALSSNNTRGYINISQLVGYLDRNAINALLASHAFTCSDYTTAYKGKGKLKALQLIIKSENDAFQDAFSNLVHCDLIALSKLADIEKFTCALYGLPKLSKINIARFVLFQNYAPKKPGDSLGKIK